MKQLVVTSLVGLSALLQPVFAAPPPKNRAHGQRNTCISNGNLYNSGTSYRMFGNSYFVHCATDSTGEVLQLLTVPGGGFADCSQTCEILDECAGFSFFPSLESGACYFKTGLGDLDSAVGDAVTCRLDPDGNGILPEPVPVPYPPFPGSGEWPSTSLPDAASVASSWGSVATSSAAGYTSIPSSYVSAASSSVAGYTTPSSLAPVVSSPSISLSAYTSPLASPASAPIPTPSLISQCQQTVKLSGDIYRNGRGSAYELQCGEDHYGDDLTAAGSDTFLGCVDICNANSACVGYSYLGNVCYLKQYLTGPRINPSVDFAVNIDRNATATPPSSTLSVVTAPTPTPPAAPGSCGYIAADGTKTYTASDKVPYTIECGTDHNGGDIEPVGAKDFVGCMDACDKTDKCIAFSWVGGNGPGTCYLKGTVTKAGSDAYVDYAYKKTPTGLLASASTLISSYASVATSVVSSIVSSVPAPPATSVSTSTYVSVPTSLPDVSSDDGGVLTVTVTSYTGTAAASPLATNTKRIQHPQPNPMFPWPLWPNPTKLPPTKSRHLHLPSVHNPLPEITSATSYVGEMLTKTAWVTSASPTPVAPNGSPPKLPGLPLPKPPGLPALKPPGPLPRFPFGMPPNIPPNGPLLDPIDPTNPNNPLWRPQPFPLNERRSVPEEPTKTFTKKPLAPTPVGNNEYCDSLRNQKPRFLRVEYLEGDYKFIGMWVQDPTRKHDSSIAHLTYNKEEAAAIAYNQKTHTVAAWRNEDDCAFRGLNMLMPDGKQPHGGNGRFEKHGECIFSVGHGTGDVYVDNDLLKWKHKNFATWLVCDSDDMTEVELLFWDTQVHGTWREDPRRCAAVRLRFVD